MHALFYLKGPAPAVIGLAYFNLLYPMSLSRKAVLRVLLAVLCYTCGYGIVCPSTSLCRSIFIYYKRALHLCGYMCITLHYYAVLHTKPANQEG